MPDGYLLDTVAASALLRRNDAILQALNGDVLLFLPIVVVAELRFGALRAQNPERQSARVESLIADCLLLDCDEVTATHSAQIKAELTEAGKMIPVNDLWIAAIARQHSLPVVTADAHFQTVSGIQVINW